jgi:hypothetical protein
LKKLQEIDTIFCSDLRVILDAREDCLNQAVLSGCHRFILENMITI